MTWKVPRLWRPGDVARNLTARVLNELLHDNLTYLYDLATATADIEPWTPVTAFLNGWGNYSPTETPAAYYKHAERTYLRGVVANGSVGAIFTVPPAYRPASPSYFVVRGTGPAVCYVNVHPDGSIAFSSGAAWLDLAAINFRSYDGMPAPQEAHLIGEWPLWETLGTTAYDRSGKEEHGTYFAATLGQPGLGSSPAPLFDGLTSNVQLPQALLTANFNGARGSIAGWLKVKDAGVLTDATTRRAITIRVNSANTAHIRRTSANNTFAVDYIAGSVTKSIAFTSASLDWIHVCLTWDKAADQMKGYVNGVQVGTTQTGLGTWAGALGSCIIGGQTGGASPSTIWSGSLARWKVWDVALTAAEVAEAARRPT